MRCSVHAALIFVALAAVAARADDERLDSFEQLVVVMLDDPKVEVRKSPDEQGVELRFARWDPRHEDRVELALSVTPLKYRLVPLATTGMMVEIFSDKDILEFATERRRGMTHVLIGRLRPERLVQRTLREGEGLEPMSADVTEALAAGKFDRAREILSVNVAAEGRENLLDRARLALLEWVALGPKATVCPRRPTEAVDPATFEAIYLSAFCSSALGDRDLALADLRSLLASRPPADVEKRAEALARRLAFGRIESALRSGGRFQITKSVIESSKVVADDPAIASLLDPIFRQMSRSGFATVLARIAERLSGSEDMARSADLAPFVSEAYLAEGEHVRGSAIASFFLAKPLPDWIGGRLHRVRGHALLQQGNWAGAKIDLVAARGLLAGVTLEDEIAVAEASLRRGDKPGEAVRGLSAAIVSAGTRIPAELAGWLGRVMTQAELVAAVSAPARNLDALPAYVLYQAGRAALERGDRETYARLMVKAGRGSGGWGVIARIDAQTTALRLEVDGLKGKRKAAR
ncbi:MAG: hypothetical protein PHU25_10310 [Deltaproteobacteria bacterium]|nr:hypothetical protein [Deltaproteobacteria bacterium]